MVAILTIIEYNECMNEIKNKDFLEETIKEQELLNISYKQSKQHKADRHLESFSDDLRNSIIKKVSSRNMIRPYTPDEERILREGLNENKEQSLHEVLLEGFKEEQLLRRLEEEEDD